MRIQGLQKLTLLDYPEKMACTVFTAGCNFRCPFCHNASLVVDIPAEEEMTEEAFFRFLEKRKGILEGVCITGGEPLLQPDIDKFIIRIKEMGYPVKLDTNGSYPDKLKDLVLNKLIDYVAMDIKNAIDEYAVTAGTDERYLEAIKESVSYLKSNHIPFEFRTTVVKHFHTEEGFEKIGQWIAGVDKYYLQKFKDSGDLINGRVQGCSDEEMEKFLSLVKKYVPNAKIRG